MKRATFLLTALLALALWAPTANAAFGLTAFDGGAFDPLGDPVTAAGSHPHVASTVVSFNTVPTSGIDPPTFPDEALEDLQVDLPPGFLGNPTAVPTCPYAEFFNAPTDGSDAGAGCAKDTRIGTAHLVIFGPTGNEVVPVYNLAPAPGQAARFGFVVIGFPITLEATLSPRAPYHAVVRTENAYQTAPLYSSEVTVWGVPADSSHDAERGGAVGVPERPFISLPTSCGAPIQTDLFVTSWEGSEASASFLSHDLGGTPVPIDSCGSLEFEPTLKARPTTNLADSPSGLEVELAVPQDEDPDGRATAHLREATVTLPEGLVVNPASANGLDGCSAAEVNLGGGAPAACPPASKLATVEVDTPLLDHPVAGAAYLADPYDNPFNSLLALYIAVEDPQSGVVVKLAGRVDPDPVTGRLSATFAENPQIPFESFRLRFFGGPGGSLRTPASCGDYTTGSSLTPWSAPESGPPETPADTWSISQGPGGGSCAAALPHAPAFDAGSVAPIAAAHSPFVLHLRREDGSQSFAALTLSPPPGLVAKLAATPACPEAALAAAAARSGRAEQASPSCPPASEVGTVSAAAGAGPAPYHAPGKAYLAGPYKGAPLSLAIVTPAVAGPFDLGTIVVKSALHVDSRTAQVTAVSDPIPQILQGIPLDVRSVEVSLDKPGFMLNGTSCDPMAVGGSLLSGLGQLAPLSSRFQLAECTRLGFKPKMTLRLKGGTRRSGHPALTATIAPRPGDANIASVSVTLPHSEFLDQSHIRTVCTRVQFAADACPAAAIYGAASVTTPILAEPLSGHLYLRSSSNPLPDLVPDLRGPAHLPLKLEVAGRTDSVRGVIRNSFDFIPDAPFTKAVVALQGGKKGLLENSRDICAKPYRATVKYTAHNGLTYVDRPKLRAQCGGKGRRGGT